MAENSKSTKNLLQTPKQAKEQSTASTNLAVANDQFASATKSWPKTFPKLNSTGLFSTTALGAAWLAGMRAGVYPDQAGFAETWALGRQFTPQMEADVRDAAYARWKRAVEAVIGV